MVGASARKRLGGKALLEHHPHRGGTSSIKYLHSAFRCPVTKNALRARRDGVVAMPMMLQLAPAILAVAAMMMLLLRRLIAN